MYKFYYVFMYFMIHDIIWCTIHENKKSVHYHSRFANYVLHCYKRYLNIYIYIYMYNIDMMLLLLCMLCTHSFMCKLHTCPLSLRQHVFELKISPFISPLLIRKRCWVTSHGPLLLFPLQYTSYWLVQLYIHTNRLYWQEKKSKKPKLTITS